MKVWIFSFAVVLLAGCAGGPAPYHAPAPLFGGLDGACWLASLADGNSDTHCFSSAVGGKLAMDVHKVRSRSGAVVYEGVTVYRLAASGVWRYDYSNAFGTVMSGSVRREGETLRFFSTEDAAGEAAIVWRLASDGYEVVAANDVRRFRRAAPAGDVAL